LLTKERNFGLDIVRAIAVLTVVFYHGEPFLNNHDKLKHIYTFFEIDGVPIFFVLSGFLIGGILLEIINNTNFAWKDLYGFWIRRWFRTLPNYYLILFFLIGYYFLKGFNLPNDLIKYFFFYQNFNTPHPNFYDVAWSLSVEEWFYLSIPLLLFITLNIIPYKKREIVLFWIVFVIVTTTLFRVYRVQTEYYSTITDWDLYLRKQVVTRLDSIMLGFLGAYLSYYKVPFWDRYKNVFFVLGVLVIIGPNIYSMTGKSFGMFFVNYFLITATPLGTLLILPKLSGIEKASWRGAEVITFISVISYSIYLLHEVVIRVILLPPVFQLVHLPSYTTNYYVLFIEYAMYWSMTILLSYLVYAYYEKPMMNLRDLLKNRK
jgi:peptidoglycan/LPS O-acetylase OafA/YrhL